MTFPFRPMRFIRSDVVFSNSTKAIDDDSNLQNSEFRSTSPTSNVSSTNPPLDAHDFYVSLISDRSKSSGDSSTLLENRKSPPNSNRTQNFSKFATATTSKISSTSKSEQSTNSPSTSTTKSSTGNRTSTIPIDILKNRYLKAASDGDFDELIKTLESNPQLLDSTDDFGWTALMCASYEGHSTIVDYLLRRGADYRLINRQNRSALSMARRRGHREIVDLLESAENGDFDRESNLEESSTDDDNGDDRSMEENYCQICSITYRDPNHETSTGHLLKAADPSGPPQDPSYLLSHTNRGFQLMLKDGWDSRRGLGRDGQGRWYPVKTILKRDRQGFGSAKAPKPRVTHFGANDSRAIQRNNEANRKVRLVNEEKLTKKEKERRRAKETEWIRKFRREFY